jgi:hypothetical protein
MRAKLRDIAKQQRAIMICILAYIVLVILNFVAPTIVALFVGLAALAVVVTSAVFVFMLAMTVYGTGAGIVLGILTLVPLVGLIVLLIVNGKATKILREYGINVGLMGADMSQVPNA